jgi:hypothetical protein
LGRVPFYFKELKMGATVTCGKNAAVMIKKNGDKVFALFEKTYEKNCYPHTPHWGCIAFGDYASVMGRIFGHAAACEGGGLQGTGGRLISPENYIAAWRREMSAPVLMEDYSIKLFVGDWSPVNPKNLNAVCEALTRLGRNDLASWLMLGERVVLRLHDDIEAVLAIYGTGKIEPPWRVIEHHYSYSVPHSELGQKPCLGIINPPSVQVMALDQYKSGDRHERLVKVGDGPWLNKGWEYSAIGSYIMDVALPCESVRTGSAKALISDFREKCKAAAYVPGYAEIRFVRCEVDEENGMYKWNVENLDKLAYLLGCGHEPIAPATFTRKFSDIRSNDDALYLLSSLKPQQYEWQIAASEKSSFTTQMDLLAA